MLTRTLHTLIAATFAGAAFADSRDAVLDEPFYVGFGGGMSFLEPESDSGALRLEEDSDFAYKLFGGYRIDRNLGIELFWADLGEAELGGVSGSNTTIEYRTYGIGGTYDFPLGERWSLMAKAGIGRLENEASNVDLDRVNDNFVYLGAGATWNLSGSWDLRAEYEYFDTDAQLLSVNLVRRFATGTSRRVAELESRIEEQEKQYAELVAASSAAAAAAQTPAPAIECITMPIELRGVDFEYRSAELTEPSKAVLDDVIAKLEELPEDVRIEIRAHTDDVGSETYNYVLSLSRARNIRNYMADSGIALDRIDAQGYGELHPVASNDTEEGRRQNRRAELVLLGLEKYSDGSGNCAPALN